MRPSRYFSPAVLAVLLVTLGLILSSVRKITREHSRQLETALLTVLRTTHGGLHLWRKDLEADIQSFAQLPPLRKLVEEEVHRGTGNSSASRRALDELIAPMMKHHGYLGYEIFAPGASRGVRDPRILSVIDRAFSGRFSLSEPLVLESPGLFRTIGTDRQVAMVAAVPVTRRTGEVDAVLAFEIDAFGAFTEVAKLGRMGYSGETYGVDRSGHSVTRSRFDASTYIELRDPGGDTTHGFRPSQPRNSLPFTKAAQGIMNREDGIDLEGYRDYRGVEVVGAWLWDEDLGMGFVTEMDKQEAYLSFRTIGRMIGLIAILVLLSLLTVGALREARVREARRSSALEQMAQARKELLATVAHDLKNPLTALLMTNDLLLKTLPLNYEFTERRKNLLERNKEAAEQMRKLIADLLDVSKIEAGKLSVHQSKCDAQEILDQAVRMVEPVAAQKGVALSIRAPERIPPIWADSQRTFQILSNLVGNAVKFTTPGDKVEVRIEEWQSHAHFSVTDHGPGIAREEQARLFERYWQSAGTESLGTGLGLAISYELVKAQGGEIWVDSELRKGSTFHFTVPFAEKTLKAV